MSTGPSRRVSTLGCVRRGWSDKSFHSCFRKPFTTYSYKDSSHFDPGPFVVSDVPGPRPPRLRHSTSVYPVSRSTFPLTTFVPIGSGLTPYVGPPFKSVPETTECTKGPERKECDSSTRPRDRLVPLFVTLV